MLWSTGHKAFCLARGLRASTPRGFRLARRGPGTAPRPRGGVHGPDGIEDDNFTNHLVLTVNVDGQAWYLDTGLGDALHQPLPLAAGTYRHGPMEFQLDAGDDWHFTHDPKGSFTGMAWHRQPTGMDAFGERHAWLSTSPESVVGFWFALEDATLDNGCLWAEPGGHRGPLRQRFERLGPGDESGTRFVELDPTPLPQPGEGTLVPLPVAAGSLVLLHGLLPHWSAPNRSDRSRHAYSLHLIDRAADYPSTNWLQRPPALPLRGF